MDEAYLCCSGCAESRGHPRAQRTRAVGDRGSRYDRCESEIEHSAFPPSETSTTHGNPSGVSFAELMSDGGYLRNLDPAMSRTFSTCSPNFQIRSSNGSLIGNRPFPSIAALFNVPLMIPPAARSRRVICDAYSPLFQILRDTGKPFMDRTPVTMFINEQHTLSTCLVYQCSIPPKPFQTIVTKTKYRADLARAGLGRREAMR